MPISVLISWRMPSWSSRNGKTIKEENLDGLNLLQKKEYKVDYRTTTLDKSDALNVKASVTYEDDLDPDNNESEAVINCTSS